MRQIWVDESLSIGEDIYHKLELNSPTGGWFPALQELAFCVTKSSHLYLGMFFSPHLKKFSIYISWSGMIFPQIPSGVLLALASTLATLPVSALQNLHIDVDDDTTPWAHFKDSLSSVILRCGPSLTEVTSPIPLSDAAINHLIRLPNLRTWHVESPPPSYAASSLPFDFPSLMDFTLGDGAGPGWLSLFKRLEDRVSSTQGTTPWSRTKESLKYLNVKSCSGPIIDIPFASLIQNFRNVVNLDIQVLCYDENEEDRCIFKLHDSSVTELATALPQLEFLVLGRPCPENTCATTIACLLSISVYCPKLEQLGIHFNTTNIVDDFKNISVDPRFQELRLLPRCPLSCLDVSEMPLDLDEPDFETVVLGMVGIFPSLDSCEGIDNIWYEVFVEFGGL